MNTQIITIPVSDVDDPCYLGISGSSSTDTLIPSLMSLATPVQGYFPDLVEAVVFQPPRDVQLKNEHLRSEAYQTMLASEEILREEWDDPEEDELWADL